MRLGFHCSFFKQNFIAVFTRISASGLWRKCHNLSLRFFPAFTEVFMGAFIAKLGNNFVQRVAQIGFSCFRFHGAFLPQFARTGCNEIVTNCRDFKNRLPQAWQSHTKGSGGHQTDSKSGVSSRQ
jgi:hypothetical protein